MVWHAQKIAMDDLASVTPWADMSTAVLRSVAAFLDEGSMQQARLVCKAWQQPASCAVKVIRPRMTGSLGLQWHNLQLLSKAFLACTVLDLRSHKVPTDSGQYLLNTSFTKVLLSNVEADPDPRDSLEELHKYMAFAVDHNRSLIFDIDVYQLPNFLSNAHFTDAACHKMMQYPASANIVKLHLGNMPVPVTMLGLGCIAKLTTLTELSVISCEDIDDEHMGLLSALTRLVELKLGPLKRCTSKGFMSGLSSMCQLQKLSLIDAIHVQDNTIACVSSSLSASLQALSLANCPQLTDGSVPYLCMPHLSTLFFSNSSFITLQGVQDLASQSSSLVDLDFRGCTCLSVRDRMKLQQFMLTRQSAVMSSG